MKKDEMESFNLDDLDVEDLERRLELAPMCLAVNDCPNNGNGCQGKQSCDSNSTCYGNGC